MQIELNSQRRSKDQPVTIGGESFEVEVSAPSFADRLADDELLSFGQRDGRWLEHRLQSTITGWKGLASKEGPNVPSQDIPFTRENLAALCGQFPEVFDQLLTYAHTAYKGPTEEAKKN